MSKSLQGFFIVSLFALAAVALPASVSAFTTPLPPLVNSIKIEVKVNGVVAKGQMTVLKGSKVIITWNSNGKGCLNNWDGSMAPSDTTGGSEGTLTANRVFVITCYGLGAAQTARVTVNVGQPDLSTSGYKITNLAPVPKKSGEYYAANVDSRTFLTLSGTVKNNGKIDVSGATYAFQWSNNGGTSWTDFTPTPLPSPFKAGASQNVSFVWTPGAGADVWLSQLCVKVPSTIVEGSTTNNCSPTTNHKEMKFVAH